MLRTIEPYMARRLFRFIVAVLTVMFFVSPLVPVQATTLTGMRDIMSRQNASVGSNHEIRFITTSGVDAPTDTITIDFPTGFDLSTIVFGDIDLYHGAITGFETSETIAASAVAGVWGASTSSQRITLTAPTDAVFGEIAVSDIVYIRIGTNAIGGINQIINPASGDRVVSLFVGGTFGDVGGLEIPLNTTDMVGVSAVVPAPGGGGGGGGGGDVTPPGIFNVQVFNITTSTADVVWDTNEATRGYLAWGVTTSYTLGSYSNPTLLLNHAVSLRNLPSNTTIHYKITAVDLAGNTTVLSNQTFTTLVLVPAPIISNVQAISITDTSAIITWDTRLPATSGVFYGLTSGYGSTSTSPGFVTSHSVSLTGLSVARQYHYQVSSTEPIASRNSVSRDYFFSTTGDATPPANVFGFTAVAGDALNRLSWTNPIDMDFSLVKILAKTDGYSLNPLDGREVYQGWATSTIDVGLENGVKYYYTNYAFDRTGNYSSGANASAIPVAPIVVLPPVVIPPVPPTPVVPPSHPVVVPVPPSRGRPPTTTRPIPPPVVTTSTYVTPTVPVIPLPVVTSTPPSVPLISKFVIHPSYYVGNGLVSLVPDSNGVVTIAPETEVMVRVSALGLPSRLLNATIHVGSSLYTLSPLPNSTDYGATFVPTMDVERVQATVQFQLEDGTSAFATTDIEAISSGRVLERTGVSVDLSPVAGATVRLFEKIDGQWKEWQGTRYTQINPIETGEKGVYGFAVNNGQYRVIVTKNGYVKQQKDFSVTRNYASVDVILPAVVPIPVIGPIIEVLQSEQARETATIAAPIAVAVAIANVATAGSLFSVLNYFWFLITQPVLLLNRKKRQKWGTVYNSLSKMPIDLVVVRLVQAETRAVIQTSITDMNGRFTFRVKPGFYRIEVVKPGFAFPSQYLKDEHEDVDLLDLYHGENIEVKEEANLSVNVPIDPIVKEETPSTVMFKRFLRRSQHAFSLVGVFVTLVAFAIAPSWLLAGLTVVQVLTYLLFRRLALPKRPKEWGIIYDATTRKPLGSAIVRIFDKKFNKLLETQVTTPKGRYGFFASKSLYFVTAEKPGFEKYRTEDINLANVKEAIVDKHIPLHRVANKLSTV